MAKKIEVVVDIKSESVEIVSDKVLTLTEQVKLLKKEIQKAGPGPEQDLLISKYNDINDELDRTNLKSREFLGALGTLPGPVGAFANSMDGAVNQLRNFSSFSFKDIKSQIGGLADDFGKIFTNIGKATGITKIYTVLNNALSKSFVAVGVGEQAAATGAKAFAGALTATGIGAIVVALGFAVSALMDYANAAEKAAQEQKDLNEAQDKMAKETLDVESQAVKRMGDLDLARAKSKGATADQIYKIEQQSRELLLNSQKRYYESLSSKDGEEGRKTVQLIKNTQNDIKVAEANFQAQQLKDRETANEKIRQKNEQHKQKIAQDNKTADDTALSLTRENAALAEKDERKRQDIELANQKLAEEEKIKALEISQKKKDAILAQINQKYIEKQKDVDAKRKEDDIKAEEDFTKKVAEIKIAAIKDENQRTIADRENKYKNDLADLEKDKEFIKKSEEEKAKIRKDLKTAADNEINKINLEAKLRQQALEKGDDDARVARIMAGATNDLDLQRKTLEEKKLKNDQYYADQLAREGLTADQIRELNDRKLADQIAYTEKSNQIERDRIAVKQKALDDIISIVGAETAVGKAALVAKQILAAKELILEIKKTITFSTQAAARSAVAVAEGTAQTAKVGFPQNIPLLIAYAAQAVGIISAITSAVKSAKSSGSEGGSTEAASSAPNYGRNYGDGGMIDGPRHAQGGVLINAEGGEAVMTRGAVTMFAPLLSALNQAGGGTSFSSGATGGARPDNPSTQNPALNQQPMIMKTYVVSQELTTYAEKEARLKDLSTL
jgi:hypothetical protein